MGQFAVIRLIGVVSLLAAVAVSPALACLWDRDTLAMEARGLPGVVEVITGRFFRPPPEFYQMRLERVGSELDADPTRLDLYDDAAVACDRLGQSAQAIAWMERKRDALDAAVVAGIDIGDHEYRYHANLGTFYAHGWLRGGGDRGDLRGLETARSHIARAIEINPNAHFGREEYQLLAIEWLLEPPRGAWGIPTLFDATERDGERVVPHGSEAFGSLADRYGLEGAVEGLTGLIVLGDAWESFDVFYALAVGLRAEEAASLAHLARLRCEELAGAGRGSLFLSASGSALEDWDSEEELVEASLELLSMRLSETEALDGFYAFAREEAGAWREAKTEYMLARLEAGSHPDTDPAFWSGFAEPEPPALPGAGTLAWEGWLGPWWAAKLTAIVVGVALLGAIALTFWLLVFRGRR